VLTDIRMPDVDGLPATRRLMALPSLTATRVLVLTTFDLDGYVYEALQAGANGFLLKDTHTSNSSTASVRSPTATRCYHGARRRSPAAHRRPRWALFCSY
jgi:DNA-binding NarL/FixJ family response regulator